MEKVTAGSFAHTAPKIVEDDEKEDLDVALTTRASWLLAPGSWLLAPES
jgi:hypothetical protein